MAVAGCRCARAGTSGVSNSITSDGTPSVARSTASLWQPHSERGVEPVWSVGRTPWVPGSAADTRAVLPGHAFSDIFDAFVPLRVCPCLFHNIEGALKAGRPAPTHASLAQHRRPSRLAEQQLPRLHHQKGTSLPLDRQPPVSPKKASQFHKKTIPPFENSKIGCSLGAGWDRYGCSKTCLLYTSPSPRDRG